MQHVTWSGRLEECEFLTRLYDLEALPSFDSRYKTASGDIFKHRVVNSDWDDDWVYSDKRFRLMTGPDEVFLEFLCEMLHPIVRDDAEEVARLRTLFNDHLRPDGWELYEQSSLSGSPVFAARRLLEGNHPGLKAVQQVAVVINAAYVAQQTTRMEAALDDDPELAIGTAKEFVETLCKTVLTERGVTFDSKQEFPKLVRQTLKELDLVPNSIPDRAKAADTIRVLLQNLATIADKLTEIRNLYGTGHGKQASSQGLQKRHARLAVGAASTLGVFIFETHQEKTSR